MTETRQDLIPFVAQSLKLPPTGVKSVLELLEGGATVPFIARYRKEATNSLDEVQIRSISQKYTELQELAERKDFILKTIEEQGKLTTELKKAITNAQNKTLLEDLYLPYKKKRKTKADAARELGLAPLAELILKQPTKTDIREEAQRFINQDVSDIEQALQGARDIAAENIADRANIRAKLRWAYVQHAELVSKLSKDVSKEDSKYADWDGFRSSIRKIASHRYLALARGEKEKALKVSIDIDKTKLKEIVEDIVGVNHKSDWSKQLIIAIEDAINRLLQPSLDREIRNELKQQADVQAVEVFASNLKDLLLGAPLGPKSVLGIDPGLRTGCKCVFVDQQGRLTDNITIYIAQSDKAKSESKDKLIKFYDKYKPQAIGIGNGTASRETEQFVRDCAKELNWNLPIVSVNEAGASVYSASDQARQELPDVDVTIRGAVSIARRLQDPLAELVKIEPKAIGVGQYQHDVKPTLLEKALDAVVEDCVHQVGVNLNTASVPLLAKVAGIGPKLAERIVIYRQENDDLTSRQSLLKIKGLGLKAFEQAAGFLRIQGNNPLDASAVHPERYALVEQMAQDLGVSLKELIGNDGYISSITPENYLSPEVGIPTLKDIIEELKKPGRDPRDAFSAPQFQDHVQTIEDLQVDMELEGVVTNITRFGAFVNIGVHQDGLVHISELSQQWVDDPAKVVKLGQLLKVRVLDVDLKRRRIALSAKI